MTTANPYADEPQATKRSARHLYEVKLRTPDPAIQPALDFEPPQPAVGELTDEAKFAEFHSDNPHVYQALRAMALARVAAGAQTVGTKNLFEQLRADGCPTSTAAGERYRLNNIYTAFYGRLLDQEPELTGRITLRRRHTE